MTIPEKVKHFQRVWKMTLPHLAVPADADAARWSQYTIGVVESAMLRTAKRFAVDKVPVSFNPQDAYRYVTSTARAITQQSAQTELAPHATPQHRRTNMELEELLIKLDNLAKEAGKTHSAQIGEQYLSALEELLNRYPAEFFEWFSEIISRKSTIRKRAEALLSYGTVDESTTFSELSEILKRDNEAA